MEIPRSLVILREACAENGIAFQIVDEFTGFIARLSKGRESRLVGAAGIGVFPLNRAGPFAIARDKAFTHYVLEQAGFRTPPGGHFFLKAPGLYRLPPGRERADAFAFAQKLSDAFAKPLVAKPNGGKGAKLVTMVRSSAALDAALDSISEVDGIALVQAFIDEPEFRLFLIDGEIAFAYRKSRPAIEGDGKTSIGALSEALIQSDAKCEYLQMQLERSGLSRDSVLEKGRSLQIDFVANIAAGGRFAGFVEANAALRAWAARVARTVGLRVTGLDVFSKSQLEDPTDITVTDVNGSPNLATLYDLGDRALVMGVWRQILEKTFSPTWPEGF